MGYNLFLDDIRAVSMVYPNKDNDFVVVRSYDACIAYIKQNGLPEFMSFDNDLGEDENKTVLPDGYAVTKWLVYESGLDLTNFKFKVHSANPVAKKQIEGLLNNYIKFQKNNAETNGKLTKQG
jgi:NAD+-processing family protein with receiver domain